MLVQKSLRNVPVNKVKEFEKDFLEFLTTNTEQLDALKAGKLTDEIDVIQTVAKKFQQNITNIKVKSE
jgi:F-type H+-transporting ATPase subunit alpha